jgi:hypothetical protein
VDRTRSDEHVADLSVVFIRTFEPSSSCVCHYHIAVHGCFSRAMGSRSAHRAAEPDAVVWERGLRRGTTSVEPVDGLARVELQHHAEGRDDQSAGCVCVRNSSNPHRI